jgi:hypothetical protein
MEKQYFWLWMIQASLCIILQFFVGYNMGIVFGILFIIASICDLHNLIIDIVLNKKSGGIKP